MMNFEQTTDNRQQKTEGRYAE